MKSLLFGTDLTLLLEQYRRQLTTIARKLCLQLFRHFRHKSLYVLLPVLGFIKKSHSCFNFFDNLAIEKTPFTNLDKGCRNAHPNWPIFQIFLWENLSPPCLNREAKKWGCFGKKIKSPFTCLKWETILGGCFWKNFEKTKKSPPDSSNREEKVFEKLLSCKLYNIDFPKLKIYWFWEIELSVYPIFLSLRLIQSSISF